MQRFERKEQPPSYFRSEAMQSARKALHEFFRLDPAERSQTRFPEQEMPLKDSSVYDALGRLFRGKCAFCETQDLTLAYRFRPASAATPMVRDGHLYYTWLANAWENIYPICQRCIPKEVSYFPVKGERALVPHAARVERYVNDNLGAWGDYPPDEKSLLLDPCVEPHFYRHFVALCSGELLALSPRAEETIRHFKLDRYELNQARRDVLGGYRTQLLTKGLHALHEHDEPLALFDFAALEFGGLWYLQCRSIAQHLAAGRGKKPDLTPARIGRTFRTLVRSGAIAERLASLADWIERTECGFFEAQKIPLSPPLRLRRITPTLTSRVPSTDALLVSVELENFKSIEHLALQLPRQPAESLLNGNALQPALLILGENSTGKSSILEAIALAACDSRTRKSLALATQEMLLDPAQMGAPNMPRTHSATVKLGFDDGTSRRLVIAPDARQPVTAGGPPVFAYGAFRQYQQAQGGSRKPLNAVATLFHSHRLLPNPEKWLLGLQDEDLDDVARALKIIMSVDDKVGVIKKSVDGKRCLIDTSFNGISTPTPLNQLSSGYRSILAMVCDIISRLMDRTANPGYQSLEHARAIVLIDEVEAHLHPRWKIQIMHVLRKALPKVTFIATSHDPLCLRGMQSAEVIVLQRTARDADTDTQYPVCVERLLDLPDCAQLTIEQLLTSDFFSLVSTDQPETEKLFATIADLLSKRRKGEPLSPQQAQVVRDFETQIEAALPIGSTEAQRLVQDAVADYLKARREAAASRLAALQAAAKQRILDILEGF